MKRIVLILLLALPAFGADVEAGIRHIVVFPIGDSGTLDIPMSRGFGATAEVFWSERLSTQFAASFANPEAILRPENAEPVDLGTLGLDIYSASVHYHFAPQSRLSAYAGAGAALVVVGNLDDQFGDDFEATFDSETTFLGDAGLRYRVLSRVILDLGVTYMPLSPRSDQIEGVNVDPLIVTAGASWRF
jgi:opacity protein-like surface antigen